MFCTLDTQMTSSSHCPSDQVPLRPPAPANTTHCLMEQYKAKGWSLLSERNLDFDFVITLILYLYRVCVTDKCRMCCSTYLAMFVIIRLHHRDLCWLWYEYNIIIIRKAYYISWLSLSLILLYMFNAEVIFLSVCGAQNTKQIPRTSRKKVWCL